MAVSAASARSRSRIFEVLLENLWAAFRTVRMREQFSGSENGTDVCNCRWQDSSLIVGRCIPEGVAFAFSHCCCSMSLRERRVGHGPGADEVTAVHHKATHVPAPREEGLVLGLRKNGWRARSRSFRGAAPLRYCFKKQTFEDVTKSVSTRDSCAP